MTTCLVLGVPAQRQGPDAERLHEGLAEGRGVVVGRRERLWHLHAATGDLRDEQRKALGEHLDLDFSSKTDTRALPLRACRKNVRLPGRPTVPATNRSGTPKS